MVEDNRVSVSDEDGEIIYMNSSEYQIKTVKNEKSEKLGQWFYDKKSKKKRYLSANGKLSTGKQALLQAKIDKNEEIKYHQRQTRQELQLNVRNSIERLSSDHENLSKFITYDDAKLETWGIPYKTVQRYYSKGFKSLFPWQIHCLRIDNNSVLLGRNLVFSAPTSGGKTMVSEILMLRRLGQLHGTILFVVPYVALVEEKSEYFRNMWIDMGICVKAFHGGESGTDLTPETDVAVCTIERANILLNNLLETKSESQLSMIIVDEIHMLSDWNRGFLLEVTLSKIKYLLHSTVQCIGMSATLPNIFDLAVWLDAALYTTEYRPVDLQVKIACGKVLYDCVDFSMDDMQSFETGYKLEKSCDSTDSSNLNSEVDPSNIDNVILVPVRQTVEFDPSIVQTDPDGVISLCLETAIIDFKSVMLFCPSKDLCQKNAYRIAECISKLNSSSSSDSTHNHDSSNLNRSIYQGRFKLIQDLKQCSVGLCNILRLTIPQGVAYHHAGLITEERQVLEIGFREGLISILCATSTLAAGVNLPAHRVIIRSPYMGRQPLTVAGFKQMCGRAGRLGLDSNGEAILIVSKGNTSEMNLAKSLMCSSIEPLRSVLYQGAGGGVERLLLELICCGKLTDEKDIPTFLECTLMMVQHSIQDVHTWTTSAIQFLRDHQFVLSSSDTSLRPSQLGIATTVSGISPVDALSVIGPLDQARKRFILKTSFHSVYLVTPPSSNIIPKWTDYEMILHKLFTENSGIEDVASFLGVDRAQTLAFKTNPPGFDCQAPKTKLYRRFYSAIILYYLIHEHPLSNVSAIMSVERGQMQTLQKDASIFCSMTVKFCQKLNWELLAISIESLSGRLSFGVGEELLPLARLGLELSSVRCRAMYKSGVKTPIEIIQAGENIIADILHSCIPFERKDPTEVGKNIEESFASRDALKSSCISLAKIIVQRAKKYLIDDANIIQQSLKMSIL